VEDLTHFYCYNKEFLNLRELKQKSIYTYNVVKERLKKEKELNLAKQPDYDITTIRTDIVNIIAEKKGIYC